MPPHDNLYLNNLIITGPLPVERCDGRSDAVLPKILRHCFSGLLETTPRFFFFLIGLTCLCCITQTVSLRANISALWKPRPANPLVARIKLWLNRAIISRVNNLPRTHHHTPILHHQCRRTRIQPNRKPRAAKHIALLPQDPTSHCRH